MKENMILEEYAQKQYKNMLREPEGYLTHRFIVPGSIYGNDLWDWDSWLTDIALQQFVKEDISEYEKGCVLNFIDHMDKQGRAPIAIQPGVILPEMGKNPVNIHKPCLVQHAAFIIKRSHGDVEWIRPYFGNLKLFIDYYRKNCRHENGIYFWIDDCAIGVDNDPCTFYRPKNSSGSILLNCFMYKELEALCYIGDICGEDVLEYKAEQEYLKEAVRKYCYDEKDGFYYSVDLNLLPIDLNSWLHQGAPRHWDCLLQRIGSWSGFLAMWSGIATPEQAERMIRENLLDEGAFWAPYGVRTLSKYEKMYRVAPTVNPSCWLGPVWGISNYMVFRGLVKYGFEEEARELAEKTYKMFSRDIERCGEMHEYYNPETGEPIINAGFQNWNLLAINMKAWLEGERVVEEF